MRVRRFALYGVLCDARSVSSEGEHRSADPGASRFCAGCGAHAPASSDFCPSCGAYLRWSDDESVGIDVRGTDPAEVQQVALSLLNQEATRREARRETDARARAAARLASPWHSGSFYLVTAVVFIGVLVLAAVVLPLWTLPLICIAAVVFVTIVGALQLKQDERLSERSFLDLMRLALNQLKLVGRHPPPTSPP